MSARTAQVTRWIIRFLVAAIVYLTTCLIWIGNAKGWDGLSLLGASIGFGVIFATTWLIVVTAAHFCLQNPRVRLLLHPVLATGLFLVISFLVLTGYYSDPFEIFWRDTKPFVGLVAAATLLDAVADALLARMLGA